MPAATPTNTIASEGYGEPTATVAPAPIPRSKVATAVTDDVRSGTVSQLFEPI
jgi:hypothetical protein